MLWPHLRHMRYEKMLTACLGFELVCANLNMKLQRHLSHATKEPGEKPSKRGIRRLQQIPLEKIAAGR